MEDLQIFGPQGTFKRVYLPCPASRKNIPQDMSLLDKEIYKPVKQLENGTDYVQEYVAQEEKELLKSPEYCNEADNRKMDDLSEATTPAIQDLQEPNLHKLYRTYSFAHRPSNNLTINAQRDYITSMIQTNAIVVLQGPTGCGKTTQVPQFILDACYNERKHCNIIVTQPRRIAAISIARRVSEERKWPLGTLVGYQVGLINNTCEDTRLTYCTTGVLLHKLINKKNMLDFTHIILDEVHERDQEMDFLLLVVKKLWRVNSRNVKIILMSATFDVSKFAKYFSTPLANKLVSAPIIEITKKNHFQKSIYYLCQIGMLGPLPEVFKTDPRISPKMLEFCVRILIVLDEMDKNADDSKYDETTGFFERHVILIFLPGIHEIEDLHSTLTLPKYEKYKWDIVVLHSSITQDEQQKIFIKPPKGHRRLVLSTNIAESSVTLPDVKYVIDFCLTKHLVMDSQTNFQSLQLTWASKANCEQRAGRAGRVMNGRVYRLVPRDFYDDVLPEEGVPEMLQAPLESVILKTKVLDMGEPKAVLALSIDPPDLSNLERTILLLKEAGALHSITDEFEPLDGELTSLGRIMSCLPLNINISKLIMLGHVFSLLKDTIIIAASMSVKEMFSNPFHQKLHAYNVRLTWADDSCSDCIAFLNVYKVWITDKANRRFANAEAEKKWALTHFVQIRVLREVKALVTELTDRLERMGVTESVGVNKVTWNDKQRPFVLKFVIAGAFYPNYFVSRPQIQTDGRDIAKVLNGLDPYSTVYLQGWPHQQPGLLYARRFQEAFKNCLGSVGEDIQVSFDSSTRVYIQFSKKGNAAHKYSGTAKKIGLPVYKAIKMRQSNIPIAIPVLEETKARRRAEELNLTQKVPAYFNTPGTLAMGVTTRRQDISIVPELPRLKETRIPILIRHVADPGHFWIQRRCPNTHQLLTLIKKIIHTTIDSSPELTSLPPIGSLVIAPSEEKNSVMYKRAVVQAYTNNPEQLVVVSFVDYGNVASIKLSDLKVLDPESEMAKIPALGIECVLANIRPSVAYTFSERWSKASFETFYSLINKPGSLFADIYSIVNGVIALNLILHTETDGDIDINKYLIENNFAVWKEEDYFSRANHDLRVKSTDMTQEQCYYYEELQHNQNVFDSYPEPPDRALCRSSVNLRGPFSPLETELYHITTVGRGKKVTVLPNSVNSVLLDTDPDQYERLLVAGFVSQNLSGSHLTLHDTTLMPNIAGLVTLIALTFTPQMELRRNTLATRYIGALCGLGYNPSTNESVFPEHDISLKFDVEITLDDLQYINRLRHWMSMGMQIKCSLENHESMEQIIICQNKVKTAFLMLIQKVRKMENLEMIPHFDKWNLYDESLWLNPGQVPMITNNIFKLHNALMLEERSVLIELKENLIELRELVNEDPEEYPSIKVQCKFCDVALNSIFEVRAHLYTAKHRQNETNAFSR